MDKPSEKLQDMFRIGIIGAGWIADKMAQAIAPFKDMEIYAIASRSMDKADAFAKEYGIPVAYGSYAELVSDPSVDLVYIATPHSHHYEHAMLALDHGKPVLVAYWFKHDLERIQKRFTVREISTSKDIVDWNAGKIPVAVIHPASAGHGLNLQAGGSTLIWFGLTWSLELYMQTNARLWRQGQTASTVVIHHIRGG